MSRSKRTLLFVIFLSANNVLVSSQISSTLQPTSLKPDLISVAKNLLSSSQRQLTPPIPETISQPVIPECFDTINTPHQQYPIVNPVQSVPFPAPTVPICPESLPQSISPTLPPPCTISPGNLPQATLPTATPTYTISPGNSPLATVPTVPLPYTFSPETLPVASLPTICPSYTIPPQIPEYSVDQTCRPLVSMPINQMPQSFSLPEALYSDSFTSYPTLSQFYESPVSFQSPTPTVTSFAAVARPVESYGEYTPAVYPGTFNIQQVSEMPSIIEIPSLDFRSTVELAPVYQPPEQQIIIINPASPPVVPDTSYMASMPPMAPPSPVIIMEGSKSRWKSWLPILLIALCDGGYGQNCGDCGGSGGCNIPIPYPIPIPTNNPIILGRGQKGKASNSTTV